MEANVKDRTIQYIHYDPDRNEMSPDMGIAAAHYDAKRRANTYKGTYVDGYYRTDYELFRIAYYSCYQYLRSRARAGRYDVLKRCIDLAGSDYQGIMRSIATDIARLQAPKRDVENEEEAKLSACCCALSICACNIESLQRYIMEEGRGRYKRYAEFLDDVMKIRVGKKPDAEMDDKTDRLEWPIYLEFRQSIDEQNRTGEVPEKNAYIGLYASFIDIGDEDDHYGLIPFTWVLTEECLKTSFAPQMGYDEELVKPDSPMTAAMLKISMKNGMAGSLGKPAGDIATSKQLSAGYVSEACRKLLERFVTMRMKKYAKFYGCKFGDICDKFLDEAEKRLHTEKYAMRAVLQSHGTRPEWLDLSEDNSIEKMLTDTVEKENGHSENNIDICDYILGICTRYIIGKAENMYDPSKSLYTVADFLHGVLPEDEGTIATEVSDICGLIVSTVYTGYIRDMREKDYTSFTDPTVISYVKGDDMHVKVMQDAVRERDEKIGSLTQETESLKQQLEKIKSSEEQSTQLVRHERKSAVRKQLEHAESEAEKYRDLYEESRAYIELLEKPEEEIAEEPDAKEEAAREFSGTKFLFVSHDASVVLPNIKKDFPRSVIVEENTDNMSGLKIDGIVVMVKHLSHSMYYKLNKYINEEYGDVPILMFNHRNERLLYTEMLHTFRKKKE